MPYLLVGLKTDLRADPTALALLSAQGITPVTEEQGQRIAAEIGARRYVECSARSEVGVQAVFQAALEEACEPRSWKRRLRRKCLVL